MSLSAIPLPIRIIGLTLLGMVAFRFLSGQTALLLGIAAALWAAALVALLYDAGPLAALGGAPGLGSALDWLTNRRAARAATGGGTTPAARDDAQEALRGVLSDAERADLLDRAYAALDGLLGQQAAAEQVETRIFEPIRAAADAGGPALGTRAPALIALVSGPAGVGLREAAFAIAQGVAGLGALDRAHIAELRPRDARTDAAEAATRKAEEARGGVLMLTDTDWMLAADPYGGATAPGVEAGLAMLDVAEANPGRLLIVATMPEGADEKLRADPGHRRWLDRLAIRSIRLRRLEEDDLLAVLRSELEALGAALDPEAERAARALLREVSDAEGAAFDNAEACRRLAEQISAAETEIALEDGVGPAPPGERRRVTRDHVLRAQETWE